MPFTRPKPIVLAILDGWGIAPPGPGNAISLAKTPNMLGFWNSFAHTQLIAHGESVGLPKHEPGNTETGHLNLGAGHIVYQDLPRINMSIADGSFFQNHTLLAAINHAKQNKSNLHIMGLIGGGGVHSDHSHLYALLRLCHEQQFSQVFIHVFTDGRDSPPTAAMTYIGQLKSALERESIGQIASVTGRYYAMDRDFRWERTAKTYFCLTRGEGKTASSIEEAINQAYSSGKTDEFIEPTLIIPQATIKSNDSIIFFNFRIDRPRQLTKAFALSNFEETANEASFDPYTVRYHKKHAETGLAKQKPFIRGLQLSNIFFATMTQYDRYLPVHVAFPPQIVDMPLGRFISETQMKQLRICESEKERFVTYYFNGQREDAFPNEERLIIPSPKVPTYDRKPEMSARETTNTILREIQSGLYDFIVINYANPDMVGHTGNIKATIKACEVVDECLGDITKKLLSQGGILAITADHGNAEEMINPATGQVDTEHNANPVPFIVIGEKFRTSKQLPQGILADVAPTLLSIMNITPPTTMTGRNLLR